MLLVYKGGKVAGYNLKVGEKFELLGQYEAMSQGIAIKFFHVRNLRTKVSAYLTPKEYVETMGLIN